LKHLVLSASFEAWAVFFFYEAHKANVFLGVLVRLCAGLFYLGIKQRISINFSNINCALQVVRVELLFFSNQINLLQNET
jgi:hypothetical protein